MQARLDALLEEARSRLPNRCRVPCKEPRCSADQPDEALQASGFFAKRSRAPGCPKKRTSGGWKVKRPAIRGFSLEKAEEEYEVDEDEAEVDVHRWSH